MRGDFTRFTFRPENHYSGVREQQGRVHLDADWNEQVDIATYREWTTAGDLIGHSGGPLGGAAFALTFQNGDLQIGAGDYFVDGILCENENLLSFTKQPDLPGAALPSGAGIYLAYLDVWERSVTVLEQPSLREVALGGPDTTTRTKTVWQVKLTRVGDLNTNQMCSMFGSTFVPPDAASTGQLKAQAAPAALTNDECLIPPGAGYRGLENQLYRVEIHNPGGPGTATFKWSRDNGCIAVKLENISGNVITVSEAGKDAISGFSGDMWVELSDEGRTLRGEAGILVQLASAQGTALTVKAWPNNTALTMSSFGSLPVVRRWDSPEVHVTTGNWLDLEDGVQIEFMNGNYVTGDYWVIPARTLTGTIDWPLDSTVNPPAPISRLRQGIIHHYASLGLWQLSDQNWTAVSDCRNQFPAVTSLTTLFYVSGDGQGALPDPTQPAKLLPLAFPLQAGVSNGNVPVPNARVRFQVKAGNGQLQGTGNTSTVTTGSDGIASCNWSLDSTTLTQEVEAVLLDASGQAIHLPLRFTANLNLASNTGYDSKACSNLQGVTTVQGAIDKLCQMGGGKDPGVHVRRLAVIDANQQPTPLHNDMPVPPQQMIGGLTVECDQPLDPGSVSRPTCYLTADIPVPAIGNVTAVSVSSAYQTLVLAGDATVKENIISWKPRPPIADALLSFIKLIPQGDPGILMRLTLKGNFIWSAKDPRVYLDGEVFGIRPSGANITDIDLSNGSGDGRRGGDFEMWFWLANPPKTKEKEKEKEKDKDKDKEKDAKEIEHKPADKLADKLTDKVADKTKETEGKAIENLHISAVDPGTRDGPPAGAQEGTAHSFIRPDERPNLGSVILDGSDSGSGQ